MIAFATLPPGSGSEVPVDWGLVGWIVAAVLSVIAIIVTVIATRRWGNRRAGAEWYVDAVPLLAAGASSTALEVTFRNAPVKDPVLVTFGIVNTGQRDITSEMFDASRSIVVRLGAPLYGVTQHAGNPDLVSPALGTPADNACVELRPRLLKRGEAWQFSAVVSGTPTVQVEAPLIDTDLKELATPEVESEGLFSAVAYSLTGVLGEVAAILFGRRR